MDLHGFPMNYEKWSSEPTTFTSELAGSIVDGVGCGGREGCLGGRGGRDAVVVLGLEVGRGQSRRRSRGEQS